MASRTKPFGGNPQAAGMKINKNIRNKINKNENINQTALSLYVFEKRAIVTTREMIFTFSSDFTT